METIREFLYNWYPDYYSDDFSIQETIELFELVAETPLLETDSYSLTSSRWQEEFGLALDEYMTM